MLTQQELKQQAADAALELVEQVAGPDVIIGVGTGSTADLFIDGLACFKGRLRGTVASSERSAARLAGHGLAVLDLNDVQSMPIYVDGADEIDPNLHMIKGGGGALTREKIVAWWPGATSASPTSPSWSSGWAAFRCRWRSFPWRATPWRAA